MIHLKLTIMALLWAGGFIAGKLITQQAGPFTISFLRFLIATIVLSVLVYKKQGNIKITQKMLAYALGAAFLGIFCYNYLFFSGIKLVNASRGAVIISAVPIVVAVLSWALFKERMSLLKLLGILVSLIGAWVVISKGQLGFILGESIGRGEVYLLICVFCAAAFTLFSKKMLQTLTPMATIVCVSAIGTVLLFLPALWEIQQMPFDLLSAAFLSNLLYLAIGPSVIAVVFLYEAISLVGPSRASQYMNLMPVFAVMLAVIFLGESLTSSLLVGGGLVTTGLYLANLT